LYSDQNICININGLDHQDLGRFYLRATFPITFSHHLSTTLSNVIVSRACCTLLANPTRHLATLTIELQCRMTGSSIMRCAMSSP